MSAIWTPDRRLWNPLDSLASFMGLRRRDGRLVRTPYARLATDCCNQTPLAKCGDQGTSQMWHSCNGWQTIGDADAGSATYCMIGWGGVLVVGGPFTGMNSVTAARIAQWDGTDWSELGTSPFTNPVRSLAAFGASLAAGTNDSPGEIAVFDGSSWTVIGEPNGTVFALVEHDGDLYAGGNFTSISGNTFNKIARWNGAAWSAVGSGFNASFSVEVRSLASYNGSLYAGLSQTAPTFYTDLLHSWNGSAWTELTGLTSGGGSIYRIDSLLSADNDDLGETLFLGGSFAGPGQNYEHIARWNGSAFDDVDGGVTFDVLAMTIYGGALVFTGGGGQVRRFNGTDLTDPYGSGGTDTQRGIAVSPVLPL